MPAPSIPVSIATPKIASSFDKKLTAGAPADFVAALGKALGKPYEVVSGSQKDGFVLTPVIDTIEHDQKAGMLKAKVSIQIVVLGGGGGAATAKGGVGISTSRKMDKDITDLMKELAGAVSGTVVKYMDKNPPPAPAAKGSGATPEVFIEAVKLANAWDAKATRDVPDWAAKALKSGLGGDAKVVSSKPKDGFVLKPTIDPVEFNEGKGEIFAKMSVAIIGGANSVKGSVSSSGRLSGIDARNLDKKLQKMIEVVAAKCGKDAADEIAEAGKKK